jgi:hypothetical protein
MGYNGERTLRAGGGLEAVGQTQSNEPFERR